MKNLNQNLAFCLLFLTSWGNALAVKMPAVFTDGMVLQRNVKIPIWGWADSNERVSVIFAGKEYQAETSKDNRWQINIEAQPANTNPQNLIVKGNNNITFQNVLIGDVWICSGQSNMEWKMDMLDHKYDEEIAQSNNLNIRAIEVLNNTSLIPLNNCKTNGGWKQANPENTAKFSAVAYFFAKTLWEKYKIPQGLILTEWGGTVAETWVSWEGLKPFPNLLKDYEKWKSEMPSDMSEAAIQQRYEAWAEVSKAADKGYQNQQANWAMQGLKTADWATMILPKLWENAGLPDVDGVVWFRKEIIIDPKDAGKDLVLNLGKIDDNDSTYFNGIRVGFTTGYNIDRIYSVPGKLIKAGKNTIAIRVVDTGGGGGIWGNPNEIKMTINQKTTSLSGTWNYKLAVNQKDLPPNPRQHLNSPNHPTLLFNAMIAPIIPYAIKGNIWYQGESNADRASEYRRLMPALITDWRTRWGQGDFPFFQVQLANYMKPWEKPEESAWAELREAQLLTAQKLPLVGLATIIDIGEATDIHPKNKLDVGKRLALAAQKIAYADESVIHSGPIYQDMLVESNAIRLTFSSVGTGLVAKNGELKGFSIAGQDQQFIWADAKIEGNTIVVSSPKIVNPVSVRYAWANNPVGCNLYNQEGLPASPFRTDDYKR